MSKFLQERKERITRMKELLEVPRSLQEITGKIGFEFGVSEKVAIEYLEILKNAGILEADRGKIWVRREV